MMVRKGALRRLRPPIKSFSGKKTASQISQEQVLEALEPRENIFKNLPTQLQYYLEYCAEIGEDVQILKSRYGIPSELSKEDFIVQLVEILKIHHEQILTLVNVEGGEILVSEHDWHSRIQEEELKRRLEESHPIVLPGLFRE